MRVENAGQVRKYQLVIQFRVPSRFRFNDMTTQNNAPSEIGLYSKITKANEVFGADVDGELVLFHPDSGSYYGAGPVGQRIWEILSDEVSVSGIIAQIVDEYDVEKETCEQDILGFLEELRAMGLIDVEV